MINLFDVYRLKVKKFLNFPKLYPLVLSMEHTYIRGSAETARAVCVNEPARRKHDSVLGYGAVERIFLYADRQCKWYSGISFFVCFKIQHEKLHLTNFAFNSRCNIKCHWAKKLTKWGQRRGANDESFPQLPALSCDRKNECQRCKSVVVKKLSG